ncbi:MAG: cholesterol transport system auxiliary component [Brevundimonas sp.]|jgi:cholesterol transport system auxiliary component|uniref:ABC-type transport auxiliary lipoprotein family protein n=1 Tax=Brevundimonas sp. TaxID=1871086 RepID=UPI0039E5F268
MSRTLILKRAAVIAAAAALTAGCALLSTPDPVQMYRFGASEAAMQAASPAPTAALRPVSMRRIQFSEAARGDRILAVTGTQAAYLSGARWVSPADQLFTEALTGAFSDQSRNTRLIGPREFTRSALSLDIDVRSFEARYEYEGAVPTAHIAVRARILQFPTRDVVEERIFTASLPASDNRVSAIVAALDAATTEISGQIVDWTDAAAANTPVPDGPFGD